MDSIYSTALPATLRIKTMNNPKAKEIVYDIIMYAWCCHHRPLNLKELSVHTVLDNDTIIDCLRTDLRLVECQYDNKVGHWKPTDEAIRQECAELMRPMFAHTDLGGHDEVPVNIVSLDLKKAQDGANKTMKAMESFGL